MLLGGEGPAMVFVLVAVLLASNVWFGTRR